jgi:phospholipid N-methyltransferase
LAGGLWNKKSKKHIFSGDPGKKLGLAMEEGAIQDDKKLYQIYYTPDKVAEELVEWAEVEVGMAVLEPSAGEGALVKEIAKKARAVSLNQAPYSYIRCIEIRPEACEKLLKIKESERFLMISVDREDFLDVRPSAVFDRVIMNPPFTRGTNLKHISHALKFLKPGGILVSIIPGGENRNLLNKLIKEEDLKYYTVEELEEKSFKTEGTCVNTSRIKIWKK